MKSRRNSSSNVVSAPSPRQMRNIMRGVANLYAPSAEKAVQGLLDLGMDPQIEPTRQQRASSGSGVSRAPRTESARAGGEIIIVEHDIQATLYGLLQRDKRVAWVARINSGKFRLQSNPGQPDRWFSANIMAGGSFSDLIGCLVSDGVDALGRVIPGRFFALEVKERSLAARRAVVAVIEAVDSGSFNPIESSEEKGRIANQYAYLLKVRRGGGVGEFVFDVDEVMDLLR